MISLTGCSTIAQYPVTAAGAVIWGTTGKTTSDHALSYATGMDCKMTRVFSKYKNEYICEDNPVEQKVWKIRGLEKISKEQNSWNFEIPRKMA